MGDQLLELRGILHEVVLTEAVFDLGIHHVGHHGFDVLFQIVAVQDLLALLVDDLALGVHHVVVFQHVLSGLIVAAFDGLLRVLDRAGQDLGVDRSILVHAEGLHHAHQPFGAEQTHDVVLHRQIEAAGAGVALTAGTTAELVVDTPGFVALGAHDEQAAHRADLLRLGVGDLLIAVIEGFIVRTDGQDGRVRGLGVGVCLLKKLLGHILALAKIRKGHVLGVAAQDDIGTASGHVGGNGDGPEFTGLRDDLRFLFMELGVQNDVLDALPLEHAGEQLGFLDGDGADQDRLALLVAFLDLPDDSPELARLGLVDDVGIVLADDGLVRGDLNDVQRVDAVEFLLLGHRRAGHAGELRVKTEEVLEGDGGKRLALLGDLHALLGLDRLVQTLVVAAAVHQTAGGLVHDDDLAVLDHVVHVPLHNTAGAHGLIDVVGKGGVFDVRQVLHAEILLGLLDADCGELDGAVLFIHVVIAVVVVMALLVVGGRIDLAAQAGDEGVRHRIEVGAVVALTGDDQRGTGLVDQDGVHLVNDRKAVTALDLIALVDRHVVAQVVKAKLVVRTVGNVRLIGRAAFLGGLIMDDESDLETHEAIDLAHPLGVALRQIVVDRDDMDALAGEGVQIGRQDGDQGLAFAGLHLGDSALVEDQAADQLDPIGLHAQHAPGSFADGGKGVRKNVVERLAPGQKGPEFLSLAAQIVVGKGLVDGLQGFDFIYDGLQALDLPLGGGAE